MNLKDALELLINWPTTAHQWTLDNLKDGLELLIDWPTAALQWALDNLEDMLELLQHLDWKAIAFEDDLDDVWYWWNSD